MNAMPTEVSLAWSPLSSKSLSPVRIREGTAAALPVALSPVSQQPGRMSPAEEWSPDSGGVWFLSVIYHIHLVVLTGVFWNRQQVKQLSLEQVQRSAEQKKTRSRGP